MHRWQLIKLVFWIPQTASEDVDLPRGKRSYENKDSQDSGFVAQTFKELFVKDSLSKCGAGTQ